MKWLHVVQTFKTCHYCYIDIIFFFFIWEMFKNCAVLKRFHNNATILVGFLRGFSLAALFCVWRLCFVLPIEGAGLQIPVVAAHQSLIRSSATDLGTLLAGFWFWMVCFYAPAKRCQSSPEDWFSMCLGLGFTSVSPVFQGCVRQCPLMRQSPSEPTLDDFEPFNDLFFPHAQRKGCFLFFTLLPVFGSQTN